MPALYKRLLLFNLRTDVDDHILGFTTRWINALSPYYEHIDVLTMHAGRIAVARNVTVYSVGREKGYPKAYRLLNFYRLLGSLLLKHRYDACFGHMTPMFTGIGGPLLSLARVHTTTWYTHRQLNWQVRLAERMSWRVVSATETSFPIKTSKLRALGHGINTAFYAPDMAVKPEKRIVQVARLMPIKNQHILLQAAQSLEAEIVLVGDIPDGANDPYKIELQQLAHALKMEDRVIFTGPQTPEQVRNWYHRSGAAVNLSPIGLFDKAALESMAACTPTIVSNPAFSPVTAQYSEQLIIPAPDAVEALRERLQAALMMSAEERQNMGDVLRYGVIEHHSLEALAEKLVDVLHKGEIY